MITLEDCIALCGLTAEEVMAIAEHEHLPAVAAAALADHLLAQEGGAEHVRDIIIDDIKAAQARGERQHVRTLLHVLHHFLTRHPDVTRLRPKAERLKEPATAQQPASAPAKETST